MSSILALDLATVTGWAVLVSPGSPAERVISGTQSFAINARVEGAGMRYLRFSRWLDEMYRIYPVQRLAFEEVKQRAQSVAAGHMYGGFMATLTSWCEANAVPYEGIPVGTIKKAWTGLGNAGKDAMMQVARERGFNPTDDNEADALALLHYVSTYATPSTSDLRSSPNVQPTRRVPLDPLRLPRRPVSR